MKWSGWHFLRVGALVGALVMSGPVLGQMRTNVMTRPGMRSAGQASAPASGGAATSAPVVLRAERQRPVEIPDGGSWWKLLGLLGGVCCVGFWAWRRWKKRPEPAPVAVAPADPGAVARARIEAARVLWGDPRAYAGAVSDAIRSYLEGRFGLRAPEQTTEEFLTALAGKPLLELRHQETLSAFLNQCDLMKFAGWRPGGQELAGLEDAAIRVVLGTAPRAAVPVGAGGGKGSP